MASPKTSLTEAQKQVQALHPRRPGFRRKEAQKWLAAHPDEALPALLEATTHPGLQVSALRALRGFSGDEVVAGLMASLTSGSPRVSHEAGVTLATVSEGAGLVAVRNALPTLSEPALSGALVALARSDDTSDCARVRPFLEHESEGVRHRAKLALDKLGCDDAPAN